MKKFLFLIVMAFGFMSFTNTDYVSEISTEDITNNSEVLNDYEISVEYNYSDEIECWTCTLTVVFPDMTSTTITGESCISPGMACLYARNELSRRFE